MKTKKVKERNAVALSFNQLGKVRTQTHKAKNKYTRKRKHKNKDW